MLISNHININPNDKQQKPQNIDKQHNHRVKLKPYRSIIKFAKPTIMLIGGFGFNLRPLTILKPLRLNPLFSNYQYIYIDINQFSVPFQLESIARQLTIHFSPQESNIIIAYSSGGLVALHLAMLIPNLLQRIIMLNSTPCFMAQEDWYGISQTDLASLNQRLSRSSVKDFLNYFTMLTACPESINPREFSNWHSYYANYPTLYTWLELIATTDLRDLAKQLTVPVTWLNAKYDQLISKPQQNSDALILENSTHIRLEPNELIQHLQQIPSINLNFGLKAQQKAILKTPTQDKLIYADFLDFSFL